MPSWIAAIPALGALPIGWWIDLRPLGLEPTLIYVAPIMEMLRYGLHVKALFHVTGEGFLNTGPPPLGGGLGNRPPTRATPHLPLIQRYGEISDREMYSTFNMGIGFCVAVPEEAGRVLGIAGRHGIAAWRMGEAGDKEGAKRVLIEPKLLVF